MLPGGADDLELRRRRQGRAEGPPKCQFGQRPAWPAERLPLDDPKDLGTTRCPGQYVALTSYAYIDMIDSCQSSQSSSEQAGSPGNGLFDSWARGSA